MGNRSLDDFLEDGAADAVPAGEADSPGSDDTDPTGDADASVSDETDVSGSDETDEADGADEPAAAATDDPVETDESAAVGADATGSPGTSSVEPAVSTYVARRGECVACGATAERRWQGEDGPVCPDCKEW